MPLFSDSEDGIGNFVQDLKSDQEWLSCAAQRQITEDLPDASKLESSFSATQAFAAVEML